MRQKKVSVTSNKIRGSGRAGACSFTDAIALRRGGGEARSPNTIDRAPFAARPPLRETVCVRDAAE